MKLEPLPAFTDNYIWIVHDGHSAIVVDPGDAQPVFEVIGRLNLKLAAILVTHHHADHIGGLDELRNATAAVVYGPAGENIPEPLVRLSAGDEVHSLGLTFKVMDVPGHTAGHIAFYSADMDGTPLLFCGDTLFSGGCGRLFEGTPAQMLASLDQFAALPGNTRVCCTHEYTLSNLKFALAVEPENSALQKYSVLCKDKRAHGLPTLPSTIDVELQINPFLRSRQPQVIAAIKNIDSSATTETGVFAALRQWKNDFR